MFGFSRAGVVTSVLTSIVGVLSVLPASASAAVGDGVVLASYRGAVINVADGWQGAQACVVLSRADTRCFATYGEADAFLGYSAAEDPLVQSAQVSAPACASGWLCLYEDVDGQGRRLQFRDEFWMYLSNYSFDRQTSSWRNNQSSSDAGHLSAYNRSTVYTCGAQSYKLQLGALDNQIYAVWG